MRYTRSVKPYIIIPAFNEGKRIGSVLNKVKKYGTVVVIDDGSKDDTADVAQKAGVIVLQHAVNLGQGAALETGFEYARRKNAQLVVTYDADGQHDATEIPKLVAPIVKNKADIALGSRFLGATVDMPVVKRLTLQFGIYFVYLLSGIKLTDTYNGFRAMNNKALHAIHLTHNRMAHPAELIELIARHKLRYSEVPVTITYTKDTIKKGLRSGSAVKLAQELIFRKIVWN